MRIVGILLVLVCFVFKGVAQHPYFYQFNNEDGLPSNEVYTLRQDDFNALWIGSDAGLLKFDGFSFEAIEQPENSHFSISNVQIFKGKSIWCQNFSGQIYTMKSDQDKLKLAFDASPYVRNFPNYTLDNKGRAWVMTDSVLFVVEEGAQEKQVFTRKQLGTKSTQFASIGATPSGEIALIDYGGSVVVINPENHQFRKWELPYEIGYRYQFFYSKEQLHVMIERRNNDRLEYAFIEVKSPSQVALQWLDFDGAKLLTHSNSKGTDYFGTDKGVFLYQSGIREALLFNGKKISQIFEGREGAMWFSSLQDGIYVIPSMEVIEWTNDVRKFEDQNISALTAKDDRTLSFGNYSGELFLLSKTNGQLTRYAPSRLPTSAVRKIDWRQDTLYVARGNFEVYKNERLIHRIEDLRNTRDFCFSHDTLYYTRSDRTGYVIFREGQWQNHTIRNKGGLKIVKNKEGVFILYSDGVYRWKNKRLTEIKFKNASILATTLSVVDDELVIGSYNQGVLSLKKGKVRTLFNQKNGLPTDEIIHFSATSNYYLVGTRKGLTVIDLSSLSMKTIDEYDGLASKEIMASIILDGIIYLGTINGLISLPLTQQTINSIPPTLRIKAISVGGKRKTVGDTLFLSYDDYQIRFQFSSVSLRSRGDYTVKYRLKGFRDEWSSVSAQQRQITFPSIPSGEYVFEMIAINQDGVESRVVSRTVIVSSPVWQKVWFYIVVLGVGLGSMFLVFRWRLNSLRRKAVLKQNMVSAQLTALKAQMNPHFLFNTLNSLQDLILKQDFKSTNYYLSKYSTLIRMILTNSEKGEVDLSEELKMLALYLDLEKLRFGDEFTYDLICQEELETMNVAVPAMIIQPFVENALKHGLMHKHGEKVLTIRFYAKGSNVYCEIEDNGIGRTKSVEINTRQGRKYDSFSTQATDERMRLLQEYYGTSYTLNVIDLLEGNKPLGTKVVIKFPLD